MQRCTSVGARIQITVGSCNAQGFEGVRWRRSATFTGGFAALEGEGIVVKSQRLFNRSENLGQSSRLGFLFR
jgi:hypothetical protein